MLLLVAALVERMTTRKIVLSIVAVVVLAGVIAAAVLHNRGQVTAVTTAKVVRRDLTSVVSGTGQIKPKTYVNIGATAFGRITHLYAN